MERCGKLAIKPLQIALGPWFTTSVLMSRYVELYRNEMALCNFDSFYI